MRFKKFICNKDITFVLIYDIVIIELDLSAGVGAPCVGALNQGL